MNRLTEEEIKILRLAIPILTKLTQQLDAPTPIKKTAVAHPKQAVDIGVCQYLNRKLWKDIHSIDELDAHDQKCTSRACDNTHGIRLCTKHKKNDVTGLIKATQGETFIIPDHVEETNATKDTTNTEETIRNMNKEIVRIHQQSKYETYNCRCHGEECFMLLFEKTAYVMDVLGLCLGKVVSADVIHSAKMKHKQRQYLEVKDHMSFVSEEELEALKGCDLCTGLRE